MIYRLAGQCRCDVVFMPSVYGSSFLRLHRGTGGKALHPIGICEVALDCTVLRHMYKLLRHGPANKVYLQLHRANDCYTNTGRGRTVTTFTITKY